MAPRWAAALAAAGLALPAASALFSTTLHGAPTEQIQPGTPGAATLTLQPWLTTVDPDVRARASVALGAARDGAALPAHPFRLRGWAYGFVARYAGRGWVSWRGSAGPQARAGGLAPAGRNMLVTPC